MAKGKRAWRWGPAYSPRDLERVQAKWNLSFPPDLIELYLRGRPSFLGPQTLDWTKDSDQTIHSRLEWPLDGILFDVENNGLWPAAWGERPSDARRRKSVAEAQFAKAPKLIPIFGHRYIPAEPSERGNPVFSVYQTDIVIYGANLDNYLRNETGDWTDPGKVKPIRFWSDFL